MAGIPTIDGKLDDARQDDGWSCEVFIPFSCLKDFPGLQLPDGTAAADPSSYGKLQLKE